MVFGLDMKFYCENLRAYLQVADYRCFILTNMDGFDIILKYLFSQFAVVERSNETDQPGCGRVF